MACIAEDRRPGKIIVDFVDASGRRRWKTFPKTTEGRKRAQMFAGDMERKVAHGEMLPSERITVREIADKWLVHCRATVTPQTVQNYTSGLEHHLLKEFGGRPLAKVTRTAFKEYIARLMVERSLAPDTIATEVLGVARAMFSYAVEERYIFTNPAEKIARSLGLRRKAQTREIVKALTGAQLSVFLGTAKRLLNEDEYLAFLLLPRTGLRMGEALGFQWGDFMDEESPKIHVCRQAPQWGGLELVKTKMGNRRVDVSADLRDALHETWIRRHEDRLRHGIPMSPWVLRPEFGEIPTAGQNHKARTEIRRAMIRVLAEAKLPPHFTPHCLRHTFCTVLLSRGEQPQYVQRQAGHESIKVTVDLYGSWIQAESPGAADRAASATPPKADTEATPFRSRK
jgi:integrase